ncbi:MAG: chromosomal replication initiator protein DnaA [Desulfobacteraceae bacterium]|nr:chromosomal replication initiator protein DnaA [Desulfobacteraceae bacterium]
MPWPKIRRILQDSLPASAFSLWIEPLAWVGQDGDTLELSGPDQFFCSWVAENYKPLIQEALQLAGHGRMNVRFVVRQGAGAEGNEKEEAQLRLPTISRGRSFIRTLHPRYTFEEFVVGESNALAHSACRAIANGDTSLCGCLYIDAGTGLGKSHLTHAVAHHIMGQAPATRLHYVNAQQLTAEMVRHIKDNAMDRFKAKYQKECDVLLMEDVHALAGRSRTQTELAETLDFLMEAGKMVILTGAVVPREIPNIDSGFRSRLSSGLITSINPPDLPTRVRIIRRKAKNSQLPLSEELVEFLAENIRGDIRQVESAIVGLKAKSCLLKTAPDQDMVNEVVHNLIGKPQDLTIEAIRDFVAGQFKVSVKDLQSKSRKKTLTFPRQVAMYLGRKHTEQGLGNIGSAFNRDHSTVVHSIRVITEAMARNGSIRGQVEHLSAKLKKRFEI